MTDTERYVTRDELAARLAEMDLRMTERFAALEHHIDQVELRMTQRMNDLALTQLRYIQGLYAAVIVGVAILVAAKVFG
jgi:hypothetical protein